MSKRAAEFLSLGVAVLTVSDSRSLAEDESGDRMVAGLEGAGHRVVDRRLVRDDLEGVRAVVAGWVAEPAVDVVLVSGGTGLTRRDITPEAIAPLASKHIPGFGELFRFLSFAEIGASTIQSRAEGWVCGGTLVFALPGSPGAVGLAMEKILLPQLDRRTRPCNFAQLLPRIRAEAPPAP